MADSLLFGIFVVCWVGAVGILLCAHLLAKIADKLDALSKKDSP